MMIRNTFLLLLALAMLAAVPCAAQKHSQPKRPPSDAEQQQQMDDDKIAIQKLHDADIEASLALDVPKLEALWTEDIVTMAPSGPAVVGRAANNKKLEDAAEKLRATEILAFDEQWQEVRIQGDWAYEWGTMSGRMHPFAGGKETDYKLNVMRVLNRQPDGTWKIARSIYNDATPETRSATEPQKPEEKKDRLKD
jgi:ketosteroid isomerase-like protein